MPASALAARCEAHFPFDGDLADTSGNGNHAILTDTSTSWNPLNVNGDYETGRFGQALRLDGSQVAIAPVDLHFDDCPTLTISLWVRFDSPPEEGIQFLSTGYGAGPRLGASKTTLSAWGGSNEIRAPGGTAPEVGKWVPVVATWDYTAGVHTLHWPDGQMQESLKTYARPPQQDLYIGAYAYGTTFMGIARDLLIDDIRVYSRVLDASEIAALQAGNAPAIGDCNCAASANMLPLNLESEGQYGGTGDGQLGGDIDVRPGPTSVELPAGSTGVPDSLEDAVAENRPPVIRGALRNQIELDSQSGYLDLVSVGTAFRMGASRGSAAGLIGPKLQEWLDQGRVITGINKPIGGSVMVAIADHTAFTIAHPNTSSPGDLGSFASAIESALIAVRDQGKTLDLLTLTDSWSPRLVLVSGDTVSKANDTNNSIAQGVITITRRAQLAGERIDAIVVPNSNEWMVVTSAAVQSANMDGRPLLRDVKILHALGERIDDIVISSRLYHDSGGAGGYAIATNKRLVGVGVPCEAGFGGLSWSTLESWLNLVAVDLELNCGDGSTVPALQGFADAIEVPVTPTPFVLESFPARVAGGEPRETSISGFAGPIQHPIDFVDGSLKRITINEEKNVPCVINLTACSSLTGRCDETVAIGADFCNSSGPVIYSFTRVGPELDVTVADGTRVVSVTVCNNGRENQRVKGISVAGSEVLEDGLSLPFLKNASDKEPNCAEWDSAAACPRRHVATGAIAHFNEQSGGGSAQLIGLQLLCREVIVNP